MICPTCHGLGLHYDPTVHAGRHGTLELCACILQTCRCRGERPFLYWDADSERQACPCRPYRYRLMRTQQHFAQAETPDRYRYAFRGDFQARTPEGVAVPQAGRILRALQRLVEAETYPRRGLFLYGPPGTGKTLLGCILLNELLLRHNRPGQFLNLSRFLQRLRDTFSEESRHHGQSYPLLEQAGKVPFLVIDDLGIQRGTEWEEEILYNLVDARYGAQCFTVVTTNQPLDEIKSVSHGRIFSRLMEMCHPVEMTGPDWRQSGAAI